MSKDEKLRLLLVENQGYEQNHASGITRGAAAIFTKWPSYIASAIWFTLFIVSLVTLLTLLIFMALVHEGKIVEQNVFIPPEEARFMASKEIQSEFCNQMIAKHHSKRQEIPDRDLKVFNSGNNIYYMVLKPLDKFTSCSVESVVRLSHDKNVFLMFLKPVKSMPFEDILKKQYSNFNTLSLNGNKIMRGSPFEGKWKGDLRSLFEAALLTVWQFGGTVLSENLLLLDRKIFDLNNIYCKVDPELISCPEQCASFVYDLIGETLKSSRNASMDYILDNAIKVYCGAEHFIKSGCTGVTRVDEMEICNEPYSRCMFVRSRLWQKNSALDNDSYWQMISEYCPVTHQHDITLARDIIKESIKTTVKTKEGKENFKTTIKTNEGIIKETIGTTVKIEANTGFRSAGGQEGNKSEIMMEVTGSSETSNSTGDQQQIVTKHTPLISLDICTSKLKAYKP